jgi:hypothetical protein
MSEHDEFGYDDPPDWLPDFSLELVRQVDALVRAFGTGDTQGKVRRFALLDPPAVYISVALTKYRAVMIGDQPGCIDINKAYFRRFDGGASYVLWQRGITVADVRRLLDKLRLLGAAFDINDISEVLDETQGDNQIACRYSVDRHFTTPHQLSIPLLKHVSIEQLVDMFDRPEEVVAVRTLLGQGICRKSDLSFMLERESLVEKILLSDGIKPDEVDKLLPSVLVEIYLIATGLLEKVQKIR